MKKPQIQKENMRRTNMKKPDSKREYESSMVKWGFWAKTAKWSV